MGGEYQEDRDNMEYRSEEEKDTRGSLSKVLRNQSEKKMETRNSDGFDVDHKSDHKSLETHLRCMIMPGVNSDLSHLSTCDQITQDG